MDKKQQFIGGILCVLAISGIGYLACSLFSLSFNINEWNTFSIVIKWIVGAIDLFLLADIVRIPFDDDSSRYM